MSTPTSMTIATLLRIAPKLPASTSILLRSGHGKGKSSVIRQIAATIRKELQKEDPDVTFPVIDQRLSQKTEGDLIGLPVIQDDATKFCPPDWYAKACNEPCFLFLDELNRATPEVMQGAFQIILDFELNGWKLHPKTRVASAINPGAAYTINEMDPALLDRFWTIDMNATVEDWLTWAAAKPLEDDVDHAGMSTNVVDIVRDFVAQQPSWIEPAKNHDPGDVQPTARSWDRLSRTLFHFGIHENPNHEDFYGVCQGYVGTEATIAFVQYAKDNDCHFSGDDILNNFKSVKKKLARLGQEKYNVAIDKLVDHLHSQDDQTMSEQQGKNVREFVEMLPDELKVSFWSKVTKHGKNKLDLAISVHKYTVDLILKCFEKTEGDASLSDVPST